MLPRHRGLGEECMPFFRKGARSSPTANLQKKCIKIERNELETYTGTSARERPLMRVRARSKNWTRLDNWTRSQAHNGVNKRLDTKDVD